MTARTLTLKQLVQGHLDSLGHTEAGVDKRPDWAPPPPGSKQDVFLLMLAHLEECER